MKRTAFYSITTYYPVLLLTSLFCTDEIYLFDIRKYIL